MDRLNLHNMSLALPRLPTRREVKNVIDKTSNIVRPVAKGAVAWLGKRIDPFDAANEEINDPHVKETVIASDPDTLDSCISSPTSSDLCGSEYVDSPNVLIALHEKDRVAKEIAEAVAAVNLKPWRPMEEDATTKDYMKESVLFQVSQDEEQKRQRARIAKEWAEKAERPIEGRRRYRGEGATEDEVENLAMNEIDNTWVPTLQRMSLARKPSNASQDTDQEAEKSFTTAQQWGDKTESPLKEKRRTSSATKDQFKSRGLDKIDRMEKLTLQSSSSSLEDQYSSLHTVVDDAQIARETVKRWNGLLGVGSSESVRKLSEGKEDVLEFLATSGMARVVEEPTSEPSKPQLPIPKASKLPRKHRNNFAESGPSTLRPWIPKPWIPESSKPQPSKLEPTVPETSKPPSKYQSGFADRKSSIPGPSTPKLSVQNASRSPRKYHSSFVERHERLARERAHFKEKGFEGGRS